MLQQQSDKKKSEVGSAYFLPLLRNFQTEGIVPKEDLFYVIYEDFFVVTRIIRTSHIKINKIRL